MIIEFEGSTYQIVISDSDHGIKLIDYKDDILVLSVHAQVPDKELLTFLKTHYKQLKAQSRLIQATRKKSLVIDIFDAQYTIVLSTHSKGGYVKNKVIYTSTIPSSTRQIENLQNTILHQHLMELVGLWEERLNFLIKKIQIKELKASSFIIPKNKSHISYAKRLKKCKPEMLSFIVAKSIFEWCNFSEREQTYWYEQHVSDWKHLSKVYAYEHQ